MGVTVSAGPKFYNKNGTLTTYSFGCGYLEVYGDWLHGEGVRLSLESSGEWHVQGAAAGKRIWEAFDTLGEARRFARTIARYTPASDAFSGL